MKGRYQALSQTFYKNNRQRLLEEMEANSLFVVNASDQMPRNGDCYHTYRQSSDFLYLCGIDQELSILLLEKDASDKGRSVLFLRKTDEHTRVWEGEKYSKEAAITLSGVDEVKWLDDFNTFFTEAIAGKKLFYYTENTNDRFKSTVQSSDDRFLSEQRKLIGDCKQVSMGKKIAQWRCVKTEEEIAMMQKAVDITEAAFRRVLKVIKPAIFEYEIEAEVIHEFIKQGANGHAYEPIVASGANACILHYIENAKRCGDGELVLFDFGAEYGNYAADLSRTIPVNGKFTERQRAVYQSVLRVFSFAKDQLVVGNSIPKWQQQVIAKMKEELLGLGLIASLDEKIADGSPAFRQYFMHGIGHFLGMDVHDVGDREQLFEHGMVLTCEPGIYIREEGLGIRLENDILITKDGPVDLMKNIPIDPDEIEQLMAL